MSAGFSIREVTNAMVREHLKREGLHWSEQTRMREQMRRDAVIEAALLAKDLEDLRLVVMRLAHELPGARS